MKELPTADCYDIIEEMYIIIWFEYTQQVHLMLLPVS